MDRGRRGRGRRDRGRGDEIKKVVREGDVQRKKMDRERKGK